MRASQNWGASWPSTRASTRFLPITIPPMIPSVDPAISKVCHVTSHPIECVTSILPFLNGKTDPISVLLLEIKALGNQTQQAIDKATKISKDSSTSHVTVTCLETCIEMYQTAIDDLNSAVESITARDSGRLTGVLSAVYTDISSCSDTFDEQPDLESPMEETDARLRKLSSNTMAIASDLVHF